MNRLLLSILSVLFGLLLGFFAIQFVMRSTDPTTGGQAAAQREVLYWVAPMDPDFRRDQPGKSPMGMDLVPVYTDPAGGGDAVRISAAVENNLGVRTARVERGPLWRRISTTAYVALDETRMAHIHLRTEGWIERLLIKAEGEAVEQGQLLMEVYAPELINAQQEYLQIMRRGNTQLLSAASDKLRALGMSDSDIRALSQRGEATERVRIYAPQAGIVSALNIREGMFVRPATNIMSLADLSSVWLFAEVFEAQSDWVRAGQPTEAYFDFFPGETFAGQVEYVYPVLDPATRTVRVRLRFDNPEGRIKPNMYARTLIYGGALQDVLSIPAEALIRSGEQERVIIALGDGRYQAREVRAGIHSGDWVEIRQGLEVGDRVVVSAQFLIDSEASLRGSLLRLGEQTSDDGGQDHD